MKSLTQSHKNAEFGVFLFICIIPVVIYGCLCLCLLFQTPMLPNHPHYQAMVGVG